MKYAGVLPTLVHVNAWNNGTITVGVCPVNRQVEKSCPETTKGAVGETKPSNGGCVWWNPRGPEPNTGVCVVWSSNVHPAGGSGVGNKHAAPSVKPLKRQVVVGVLMQREVHRGNAVR